VGWLLAGIRWGGPGRRGYGAPVAASEWERWHRGYDEPGSSLQRRLERVRARVALALDEQPVGPVAVLSMCAGQGRDLVPVLAAHPRRDDVRALLVELDPVNAAAAGAAVREAGLAGVTVRAGDASATAAYADIVPVGLALVCGVFGNIPDDDVRRTVRSLPTLLRPGATVVWTRHRLAPDLTPSIMDWFAGAGFDRVGYDTEAGYRYGVGVHRLVAGPRPFDPGITLFRFDGDGAEASR